MATAQPHPPAPLAPREAAEALRWAGGTRPADFLRLVESHMLELVGTDGGAVPQAAREAIQAGGKRLRPLLVLAGRPMHVARPASARVDPWVRAAAAVELVHTASLVHDDVLDRADVRRGMPTVASAHGRHVAVAVGDLLFSLAFASLVRLREDVGDAVARSAVSTLARVARTLAEGEALQASQANDVALDVAEYFLRCEQKTGVLFAAALELGAMLGAASAHDAEVLRRFGMQVGVAFQLADDILDCLPATASASLGKIPGADVRDGTMTLPLLLAAARSQTVKEALRTRQVDVESVLDDVVETGVLEECAARSRDMALEAAALLQDLRGDFAVEVLQSLAMRSVQRSA